MDRGDGAEDQHRCVEPLYLMYKFQLRPSHACLFGSMPAFPAHSKSPCRRVEVCRTDSFFPVMKDDAISKIMFKKSTSCRHHVRQGSSAGSSRSSAAAPLSIFSFSLCRSEITPSSPDSRARLLRAASAEWTPRLARIPNPPVNWGSRAVTPKPDRGTRR